MTKSARLKPLKPSRIEIRKLFGKYNHDIDLHQATRVTMLVGINGTGKSTLLRIIHKVAIGDFIGISKEPFEKIKLFFGKRVYEFKKTSKTIIIRHKSTSNWSNPFKIKLDSIQSTDYQDLMERRDVLMDYMMRRQGSEDIEGLEEEIRRIDRLLRHYRNVRVHTGRERSGVPYTSSGGWIDIEERRKPDWLKEFIRGFTCHLVSAQRLFEPVDWSPRKEKPYERRSSYRRKKQFQREKQVLETIFEYADKLSNAIQDAQKNHSFKSLELNQRYLGSILRSLEDPVEPKDRDIYIQEIEKIRTLEQKLVSTGLLRETRRTPLPESFWNASQEPIVASVIDTYIDGTKEMFKVFEKLLDQTTLFSETVNSHLTDKQISIDADFGFSIKLADGSVLDLGKLSSGEQQIIVLSYSLIFVAPENSFVLIDEPELSLHAAWKEDFNDDLRSMGKSKDLIFLLATHSISIIDNEFDKCYELSR